METIACAVDQFLEQRGARSEHTRQTYGIALGHFLAYLVKDHQIQSSHSPTLLTPVIALGFPAYLATVRWRRVKEGAALPLIKIGRASCRGRV